MVTNTTQPIHVSLTFTATYCSDYETGMMCNGGKIVPFTVNHNISISTIPTYYSFYVDPSTNADAIVNKYMLALSNPMSAPFNDIKTYASYRSVPDPSQYDVTSGNSLTVNSPTPGYWIVSVSSASPAVVTVQNSSTSTCPKGKFGPDCADASISNASAYDELYKKDETVKANAVNYYVLYNKQVNDLLVSIKLSDKDAPATLYASFGRIPVSVGGMMSGFDLQDCNVPQCSPTVRSLSLQNAKTVTLNITGEWFIAVKGGSKDSSYLIWFNYVCPNNCSTKGKCHSETGDKFGTCDCNENFEGITCSDNNMFIEYIILIIIAALVLVSALLGLIAWAYMRRRSQYVEVK